MLRKILFTNKIIKYFPYFRFVIVIIGYATFNNTNCELNYQMPQQIDKEVAKALA